MPTRLRSILERLFPKTIADIQFVAMQQKDADLRRGMQENFDDGKKKGYESGRLDGYEAGVKDGFQKGIDHRKSYVSFQDEKEMPLDFFDYSDEQEREDIHSLTQSSEYQSLKRNMQYQAMLKWRQARLATKDAAKSATISAFGDFLMDLISFYDHAGERAQEVKDDNESSISYDNIL